MKNTLNRARTSTEENESQSKQSMDSELHELFLDQLADALDAEKQLTKALPKVAKAAHSEELREAIEQHLEETENHVTRLGEVFESIGDKAPKKSCAAMQGLITEAGEIMKEKKGSSALDAALIAAAQKVEHYEIATYGTLLAWAETMGHNEAADLLRETLDEEKAADEKLTSIAEESSNKNS